MLVATASAPASVGNVAVGFDVLGHTLNGPADRATVRRIDRPEVRVGSVRGVVEALPMAAHENTAGAALLALREALRVPFGFEVSLDKGIPLGSGLGGSAASAVAALVAANALLERPLSRAELLPFAVAGEAVASGAPHADNVGPQLVGGLVVAAHGRVVPVPVPAGWFVAVVHPHFVLPTRVARAALSAPYPLADVVHQSGYLALFLAGCAAGDESLVRAGLVDVLVEPRRAPLVPGFAAAKAAALAAGAFGASLSGAGPSVFGWFGSEGAARAGAEAMAGAFAAVGLGSDRVVSPLPGPRAELVPCAG